MINGLEMGRVADALNKILQFDPDIQDVRWSEDHPE